MIIQTQTKDEEYERLTPLHFDATEKNLAIFRFGHAFDLVGPLRNHLMSPFSKDETGHGSFTHLCELIRSFHCISMQQRRI